MVGGKFGVKGVNYVFLYVVDGSGGMEKVNLGGKVIINL